MAKTDTARRRKKQNKVVEDKNDGTKKASVGEQILETEEITDVEMKGENQGDEQAAIEVKRNTPKVFVTWEKENEEEGSDVREKMSKVTGKRKADPATKMSLTKKTKLIKDAGYCVFIGNLNTAKTAEEIQDSLAQYLTSQSLLFQNIRLNNSRKYAFVDLVSEMDLTKALALDGENILDKPITIARAKVTTVQKALPLDKKAKDARCLFLKNVPYSATKEDILKVFPKAVGVRFPGRAKGPTQGIAFVEFKNDAIPKKILEKNKRVMIQDRVLIVNGVGEAYLPDNNESVKPETPPNETLFVGNLAVSVKEKHLKNVFQKAVSINIPQTQGKPKRYAFVEFATVADARKALQSSQNMKLCKKAIKVEFCNKKTKPQDPKVPSKTLIVANLSEKTTAETLKNAFEGALCARIPLNKKNELPQRFGFVDFGSEKSCKAAKEAMEDCEIDGSKVIVAYARSKGD